MALLHTATSGNPVEPLPATPVVPTLPACVSYLTTCLAAHQTKIKVHQATMDDKDRALTRWYKVFDKITEKSISQADSLLQQFSSSIRLVDQWLKKFPIIEGWVWCITDNFIGAETNTIISCLVNVSNSTQRGRLNMLSYSLLYPSVERHWTEWLR